MDREMKRKKEMRKQINKRLAAKKLNYKQAKEAKKQKKFAHSQFSLVNNITPIGLFYFVKYLYEGKLCQKDLQEEFELLKEILVEQEKGVGFNEIFCHIIEL